MSETSVTDPAATVEVAPPPAGGSDRRERKKRQTRAALVHAALELFEAKGYEQTAVREITDAVDVATRTFFRYFASKEDLVVSLSTDFAKRLAAHLTDRPVEETPIEALRNAFEHTLRDFTEGDASLGEDSVYLRIVRLVEGTPSLLAAYLLNANEQQKELAHLLAQREGVDELDDLRPRIASTVFISLLGTATQRWKDGGGYGAHEILGLLDEALEHLGPAVAGHWTPGRG